MFIRRKYIISKYQFFPLIPSLTHKKKRIRKGIDITISSRFYGMLGPQATSMVTGLQYLPFALLANPPC
jgi:hypothetical protein